MGLDGEPRFYQAKTSYSILVLQNSDCLCERQSLGTAVVNTVI